MVQAYEEGGVQVIDFECLNGAALKINWHKSFNNSNSLWYLIPNYIFQKFGGIKFFLRCDFDLKRLPANLSSFHQQVLTVQEAALFP